MFSGHALFNFMKTTLINYYLQTLIFKSEALSYLNESVAHTMSVHSLEGPQGAPDLIQLLAGVNQLTLKLQHHTLVLVVLTAVEPLQFLELL